MKKFFASRWCWFLVGLAAWPVVSSLRDVLRPPTPKDLLPFESVREETTLSFRFDADYRYRLRSQATQQEFSSFIKKMDFESHRVNDNRYEKRSADGRSLTTISYEDGWIVYEEVFT